MVTPLQLVRIYVTVGSYSICRPLSITEADPSTPGERVFPEPIIHTMVHMMENMALPGGGGAKAAIKGYHITIKTGTTRKTGSDGRYINRYIAYAAGVMSASQPRFALAAVINGPRADRYYGGVASMPAPDAIMSGVLYAMSTEPGALTTGDKNEFVISQGEGTGGRS